MRRLCLLTLSLTIICGGATGTDTALAKRIENVRTACPAVVKGIGFYKTSTWKWQDTLEARHTKASRTHIGSCKYGTWVAKLWRDRAWRLRDQYRSLERANRDFGLAARLAHRVFPDITETRLWYRASVEGGHGSWYCNHQGSGACGWFQFMEGTYYGRASEAFRKAHERGFLIPSRYNNWYSLVGQNLTAAYMFSIGLECAGEGWAASC